MQTLKGMPVGIQSFSSIIEGNYVYVDKTHFIPKLEQLGIAYFLSRPRRFGKSLFISMLQAYFEGRSELFKGLFIEKFKAENGLDWKKYPVLKLDLNAKEYTEKEQLITILNDHINKWKHTYGIECDCKDPDSAFAYLIEAICKKYEKKVVILVDEYDKPLISTLENSKLNDQYRSILKAFYAVIKSSNDFIHISFLTGVTKFSKVSIFSDLNNLFDITSDSEYSSICGITEEELEAVFSPHIKLLSDENNKTYKEMMDILRCKYDGYRFSEKKQRIYNPFSLLHVFKRKRLGEYWFSSATPTFMVNMFEQRAFNIPDLEANVEVSFKEMENYRINYKNIAPLLFQTGYLTIKDYNLEEKVYLLGFPNDEVRYAFIYYLLDEYNNFLPSSQQEYNIRDFTNAMKEGDIERVLTLIKSLMASIPYDSLPQDKIALREQNYQTIVYLIFRLMGERVRSEVHSAKGRSDVEVETADGIYIFEFKVGGTPQDAIEQIKMQGYADKYTCSTKALFLIGVSISEDKRTLERWQIEKM